MPGVVVTVDVTNAPASLVCTKVNAGICRKLFKVPTLHVGPEEYVEVDFGKHALLDAALKHFDIPLSAYADVV